MPISSSVKSLLRWHALWHAGAVCDIPQRANTNSVFLLLVFDILRFAGKEKAEDWFAVNIYADNVRSVQLFVRTEKTKNGLLFLVDLDFA